MIVNSLTDREKMDNEKDSLLKGIRILDLADEKGSFCSKILSDLGALVIKVERPGGDPARKKGPFLKGSEHPYQSLSFFYNNTNKLGITLNLEESEGRELFLRLTRECDVVVETFPPGHLEELDLGYEVLRKTRPGLILVSISGFGQSGPRKSHKSCDLVASAYGGQMYVTGAPASAPLKIYGEQSYYSSSLFAAIGILLALRQRRLTGQGDHIDISLQEAVTSTLEHVLVRYFFENIIPNRQGSLHWNHLFHVLPCKDGFIQMTLFEQWETLVEWMDGEGMAGDLKDTKWHDEEYRVRHLDHIIELLEGWTKNHTVDELFKLGQLMRFPWAPVHSPKDIGDSPQLRERNFFFEINHSEIQTSIKYPGLPFKFTPPLSEERRRAPFIGEHNTQIFQKELGLSEEEIQRLSSQGVI
jgi:crotonobetainyl-CoA:carnitine CoA-transferase CaiB-like acyl-CoA transferase